MISASKTNFSHYNLKILRPKVTKNLKNFRKKFCESPPRIFRISSSWLELRTPPSIIDKMKHFWRKTLSFDSASWCKDPSGNVLKKMHHYFTQRYFWKIDIKLQIAYFFRMKKQIVMIVVRKRTWLTILLNAGFVILKSRSQFHQHFASSFYARKDPKSA